MWMEKLQENVYTDLKGNVEKSTSGNVDVKKSVEKSPSGKVGDVSTGW